MSSASIILLTVILKMNITLQNIWRRFVGLVLINISPSNIFPIMLFPESYKSWLVSCKWCSTQQKPSPNPKSLATFSHGSSRTLTIVSIHRAVRALLSVAAWHDVWSDWLQGGRDGYGYLRSNVLQKGGLREFSYKWEMHHMNRLSQKKR